MGQPSHHFGLIRIGIQFLRILSECCAAQPIENTTPDKNSGNLWLRRRGIKRDKALTPVFASPDLSRLPEVLRPRRA